MSGAATITACAACRFWQPGPQPEDERGECRRYAPWPGSLWPRTAPGDWCGEAEARTKGGPR